MIVYIRRIERNKGPWFQIINNTGVQIIADYRALLAMRKRGHEIMDIDAVRAECARNN